MVKQLCSVPLEFVKGVCVCARGRSELCLRTSDLPVLYTVAELSWASTQCSLELVTVYSGLCRPHLTIAFCLLAYKTVDGSPWEGCFSRGMPFERTGMLELITALSLAETEDLPDYFQGLVSVSHPDGEMPRWVSCTALELQSLESVFNWPVVSPTKQFQLHPLGENCVITHWFG